jgi:predicted transcriptional regulator
MLFESAETRCLLKVLEILSSEKSKYSIMFKSTKVSHTTLQSVLKEANIKGIIQKSDLGHQNVDYKITEKGKKVYLHLIELFKLIK